MPTGLFNWFSMTYPLGNRNCFSGGKCYPSFEQPGPELLSDTEANVVLGIHV